MASLRRNVAGQSVKFALVSPAGVALTGATVSAFRALDDAVQAAATGTVTELANGQYRFNPSQADTDGDYVGYLFTATGAVPVGANFVTIGYDPRKAHLPSDVLAYANISLQGIPPIEDDGQGNSRFTAKFLEAGPQGGGLTYETLFRWSSDVTATDPGSGFVKGNNATLGSITELYMNEIDRNGRNISGLTSSLVPGDRIQLARRGQAANFGQYQLTAVPVDNGGWFTLAVTHLNSGGSLSNNNDVDVQVLLTGTRGANVLEWLGTAPNALIAGNVPANTAAMGNAALKQFYTDSTGEDPRQALPDSVVAGSRAQQHVAYAMHYKVEPGPLNYGQPIPATGEDWVNRIYSYTSDGTRLWAGGKRPTGTGTDVRLLHSDDNGVTWVRNTAFEGVAQTTDNEVRTLFWDAPTGRLFAGTQGGTPRLYMSTDRGATWANVLVLDSTDSYVRTIVRYGAVLIMSTRSDPGTGARIYGSDNDGDAWTQRFQFTNPINIVSSLAMVGSVLHCTTDESDTGGTGGVFTADNAAATAWTKRNVAQFGNANLLHSLVNLGGVYYLGTLDVVDGAALYWATPDVTTGFLTTWTVAPNSQPGLPDEEYYELTVFDGALFAASVNKTAGGRLFVMNGEEAYLEIGTPGHGGGAAYQGFFAMQVHQGTLHASHRLATAATQAPCQHLYVRRHRAANLDYIQDDHKAASRLQGGTQTMERGRVVGAGGLTTVTTNITRFATGALNENRDIRFNGGPADGNTKRIVTYVNNGDGTSTITWTGNISAAAVDGDQVEIV